MLRPFFRQRQRTLLPAVLETMEARQLLSSSNIAIVGTAGDDHIVIAYGQTAGDLTIVSAPGFEDGTILHDIHGVFIDGGDGNDTIEAVPRPVHLSGSGMNATLRGGAGDDILLGGNDNIYLDGGPGNDVITGRSRGNEWQSNLGFQGALHGVVVRLDQGRVLDDGFGTQDLVSGIGDVQGTRFDDIIYTGEHSYTMYGKGGDDLMVSS